jgi:hypothetical protein
MFGVPPPFDPQPEPKAKLELEGGSPWKGFVAPTNSVWRAICHPTFDICGDWPGDMHYFASLLTGRRLSVAGLVRLLRCK